MSALMAAIATVPFVAIVFKCQAQDLHCDFGAAGAGRSVVVMLFDHLNVSHRDRCVIAALHAFDGALHGMNRTVQRAEHAVHMAGISVNMPVMTVPMMCATFSVVDHLVQVVGKGIEVMQIGTDAFQAGVWIVAQTVDVMHLADNLRDVRLEMAVGIDVPVVQ